MRWADFVVAMAWPAALLIVAFFVMFGVILPILETYQ